MSMEINTEIFCSTFRLLGWLVCWGGFRVLCPATQGSTKFVMLRTLSNLSMVLAGVEMFTLFGEFLLCQM